MAPKTSVVSTLATLVPKSPPKTRKSTRMHAQSSTDTTVERPVKKAATGEEEGNSRPKQGKGRRGKGVRCVTN
jgi:hypothetical protein